MLRLLWPEAERSVVANAKQIEDCPSVASVATRRGCCVVASCSDGGGGGVTSKDILIN